MAKKEVPDFLKADIEEYEQTIAKVYPMTSEKKAPVWINRDKKTGKVSVFVPLLGQEIIEEIPMTRVSAFKTGARYDYKDGVWRMDGLNEFLESYITDKLDSENVWTQNILASTKKYITSKIYDESTRNNPFNDSNPYLVNFKNGTYNIKTDEMQANDPKDYIMQNHDYELDMSGKDTPCIDSWLNDLVGESSQYICEMIGYTFYRSYDKFQDFTILQGEGGEGKSTFLNFLSKIVGINNTSNVSLEQLGDKSNRFSSSQLYQKDLNYFADISSGSLQTTNLIKALTGEDVITAEFKGQDSFNFMNHAKLVFSANELPTFKDQSDGFKRRIKLIKFNKKIDEAFKKKHDLNYIYKEIPAFAYKCLKALNKAFERGATFESSEMMAAKNGWIEENDHASRFISEYCIKEAAGSISATDLYDRYVLFCESDGLKAFSKIRFSKQLERIGIVKQKIMVDGYRAWRFKGIKLAD